jgi:hypothetical protein
LHISFAALESQTPRLLILGTPYQLRRFSQSRRISTMDRKLTPLDVRLPADIVKLTIDQHGPLIRLSYMEIASGINRLLHRGIPKEVIAQVVGETIASSVK